MNKLFFILSSIARSAILLLLIVSLVVSGAGAAQRIITQAQTPEPTVEGPSSDPILDQGPIPSDELPGNMENTSKPYSEQTALVQSFSTFQTDNYSVKIKIRFTSPLASFLPILNLGSKQYLCGSLAEVNTSLSHQHTLVGHKPSGTI